MGWGCHTFGSVHGFQRSWFISAPVPGSRTV
ncbi:hypothetical protein SCALM49S_04707 [Streptomyces californicus]